jgi:excinuclease ABC subunit C
MLDFPIGEEDRELLSEYLSLGTRYKVAVKIPERGEGRALCDMAAKNAAEAARQYRLEGEREDKSLRRLCELLGIGELPRRIEAYDISNIGDESITASMVVYKDGALRKSDYRIFGIKTTDGADDYGSMREALTRRLAHIGDGSASLGERPDMLLIDGGVGHVSTIKTLLADMGIYVPVFGMVKDEYHKTRTLTDGENEISIAKDQSIFSFFYRIQEEVHRFTFSKMDASRRHKVKSTSLTNISGIGPSKAKALMTHFKTISAIRNATVTELCEVAGITENIANNIVEYYNTEKTNENNRR